MKLKAMVSRHFAHWVASYENDLYTEDSFIDIYTLRTIHLLTILSKYRILKLTRYAIGGLEFNIDKQNIDDYNFWKNNICKASSNYSFLELYGKTTVYEKNIAVDIDDIFLIAMEFGKSSFYIWVSITIQSDNWLPYHVIEKASINHDYNRNSDVLNKAMNELFYGKHKYNIEAIDEYVTPDVIGGYSDNIFKLENLYTFNNELIVYNKIGKYIDSVNLNEINLT